MMKRSARLLREDCMVNRQDQALSLAEELLADIELRRLKAGDVVHKASRLARLVGHDELQTFLRYEREGYPSSAYNDPWVERAGRKGAEGEWWSAPLSHIEAAIESSESAITALRGGGNYSGEFASVAAREHDHKIVQYANQTAPLSSICGAVVSTTYSLVTEIYHELLFSELQSTLFATVQTNVDGALAAASGTALDKIERVSERLRDGDAESVSQGLTTS